MAINFPSSPSVYDTYTYNGKTWTWDGTAWQPPITSTYGVDGIDVNPGSDIDADLVTVGVTDAPRLYWDESLSAFRTTETVVTDNDLRVIGGYVKIGEQAVAQADTAGYGQLWVRDDAPNTLMFTDDAGNDEEIATLGDTQTLTNKTLTAPVITGTVIEDVYAITGTTPALDPANGSIQTWTLTGNSTPTDSLSAGEAITLMIDDGTDYAVTWPTITWVNNGGTAPTLATTGYTVIAVWKVGTTLYGALVGDGS